MERWLLLSNCQTTGLTNCFNLLNPDFDVTGVDIWEYRRNVGHYNVSMANYFRIIISPEFQSLPGYDAAAAAHLSLLPGINFSGYHPDLCYVSANGVPVAGPLDTYHSLIALAAFRHGVTLVDTLRLYNAKIYEKCGYFDGWVPARDRLIADFAHFNIDIREAFPQWGLRGAFMYSVNHPRIHVVRDIARLFMRSHGVKAIETDFYPHDNLANGPYFPVFPEIGEMLGVEGSYMFKPMSTYRYLSLEQYIKGCFDTFAHYPRDTLVIESDPQRYERVASVIQGAA